MFRSVKRLKRANRCVLWLLKSQENILVWVPHRAWPQPETSTGSTFCGEWCSQLRLDTCIFNMTFSGMLQTGSVSLSVLVICPKQVRVIANRTTNIFCFLFWLMKDSKYSFQCHGSNWNNWREIQLNLSTMATLGTEESGRCKELAVVEGSE